MTSTKYRLTMLAAACGLWLTACAGGPGAAPESADARASGTHAGTERTRPGRAVSSPRPQQEVPLVPPLAANPLVFSYAVISVADLEQALALWQARFGMELVARREGTDPGLAQAWGVGPGEIIDQALLRTPGMEQGGVHLVRFRVPGPAVRETAAPTDLVPKSVDIATRDLPARHAELVAAGYKFRSPIGKFVTDKVVVHEVHLRGPDAVNLVFLEQEGHPEPVSPQGYGVMPQIVAISPDNRLEKAFFEGVLGLKETSYNRFGGPEVEKTVGLPKGANLDIRIFGDPAYDYGRLEIVQYEGVDGADLYPRAVAPARGLLSVTYFVPDVAAILARATAADAPRMRAAPVDHGVVASIFGQSRMATLTSPAGLRIDLIERR
ncbi:MAG: VOC family protein [Sinobacteraceae bacterium]|nr:VOC family protein [Nevskiaceae bacterium]MCP5338553.1 VOC family protein [Nevskiaceae bacterium]MCP5466769.1 VOC family protein [Nevskiaceae bacterium]MCP5470570.1 VOC family protein [Nevskiaceae bacterium]